MPEDERTLLQWSGHGGLFDTLFPEDSVSFSSVSGWILMGLSVLLMLGLLVVQIGQFFFRSWARRWWTVSTVIFLVASLGFGWSVSLPFTQFSYDLTMLMEELILALIYASPLASLFIPSHHDHEHDHSTKEGE